MGLNRGNKNIFYYHEESDTQPKKSEKEKERQNQNQSLSKTTDSKIDEDFDYNIDMINDLFYQPPGKEIRISHDRKLMDTSYFSDQNNFGGLINIDNVVTSDFADHISEFTTND